MTTFNWTVANLERTNDSDKVVTIAHYRVDGGNGGAYNGTTTPQSGATNTGGGGGAWGAGTTPTSQPSNSGSGGSGIVIIRYAI